MSDPQPSPPLHADALARIEAFMAARGISEMTFGTYAVRDASFVARLREGRATFKLAQRALDYIDAETVGAAAAE